MKNIFPKLFQKKRPKPQNRLTSFDITVEDEIDDQVKKTLDAKSQDVPLKDILNQAKLKFKGGNQRLLGKYSKKILPIQLDLDDKRKELQKILDEYSGYATAEQSNIPDKDFETADKLKAKHEKLQSLSDELEEFNSQSKNTDHDKS